MNDLVAGLHSEIEISEYVESEEENFLDIRSPVALIPQHIGYIYRENIT